MNFLEADVDIKVDDSKLPAQLAKAKSAVTRTVIKIKASFSKMAASFKTAFNKMVRIAKWGALAIAGALTLVIRAAMKQEDVLERLNIVLKSTGYVVGLTREELVKHAKALQKVTVYGDETIQSMQALLLTFKSIRGEVFMRTTEAILDLSKAMGQDLQQSVIQIGKAINDPVLGMTALRRVGIQFTVEQEKMIKALVESGNLFEAQGIILTELESQFGGMSKNIDTARGKWSQMWNALGDVAEIIGNALLPGFKDTTTAIKEWAEKNQERIGYWAKEVVSYIGLVKDAFVNWVRYLQQDWKAGVGVALDVVMILFKGFWESSVAIMYGAGRAAGRAFVSAFGEPITKFADEWLAAGFWKRLTDPVGSAMYALVGDMAETIKEYNKKTSEETIQETKTMWEKLKQIAKTTATDIKKVMPPPTQGDFVTTLPPVMRFEREPFSWELKKQLDVIKKLTEEEKRRLQISEEAGKNYERMMDSLRFEYDMLGETNDVRERAIEMSTVQAEIDKMIGADRIQMMEDYISLYDKLIEKQNSFGHVIQLWINEAGKGWKKFGEILTNTFDRAADSFAAMLMKQKIDWKAFGAMFIQELLAMIIKLQAALVLKTMLGWGGGLFGGGGKTFTNPMAVFGAPVGAAEGGEITQTGWAKVHKGEVYSGVNNEMGFGSTVVNISDYAGVDVEVNEYKDSDQRIIDVSLRAAAGNGTYRRVHNLR